MSGRRWLAVALVALVAIVGCVIMYYNTIQRPYWSEENAATAKAVEAAELTSVESATRHVWEKPFWIVEGINQAGEDIIVSVPDVKAEDAQAKQDIQVVKASEGIMKADVKRIFIKANPDAEIKRMQLGIINNELAYEVFFTNKEGIYYYAFYSFKDGAFIDQYRLPAKTAK